MKTAEFEIGRQYSKDGIPVTLISLTDTRADVIPYSTYSQHGGQTVRIIHISTSHLQPLGQNNKTPLSHTGL